jgi:hypothetical protein
MLKLKMKIFRRFIMNSDIKNGAKQFVKGLKAEARDFTAKVASKLDEDKDGKIEFDDLKKQVTDNAKEGVDKLKAIMNDDQLPEKTKEEIGKAIDKIKPMLEARKMDVEIRKEKIEAEIEHRKQIEEMKSEIEKVSAEE